MVEDNKQAAEQAASAAIVSIGIFAQVNPLLNEIAGSSLRASKSSARVAELFASFLGVDVTPTPGMAKGQTVEPLPKISIASTKENAFDLAKLALIIPFLIDSKSREYIASFIKGLVGAETLDKIETTLKVVGAALAGVFAVKLFKQVSDTITTFQKLSQLTGVLFGLTQESNELEVEDARKTEQEKWEKRKEKYEKNKSEHRRRRLEKLEKARKVRKVLKALGTVAKLTGIGFVVGAAADAFVDSIFDYFTNDEKKVTDPEFPESENDRDQVVPEVEQPSDSFGANILKKFISNLTLGTVSEKTIDRIFSTIGKFFSKGQTSKETQSSVPENKPAITSGLTSEQANNARAQAASTDPRIVSTAGDKPTTSGVVSEQATSTSSQPIGAQSGVVSTAGDKPTIGGMSEQATSTSSQPIGAQSEAASVPEPSPVTTGVNLNTSSAEVIGAKKDLALGNITINNIDNSVLIAAENSKPKDYGSQSYSVSVGV